MKVRRFYETNHRRVAERAILVALARVGSDSYRERFSSQQNGLPGADADESLTELDSLARTAGATVVGQVVQHRPRIDPAYFIGSGKVAEIRDLCQQEGANLLIFDDDLSPAQVRNLEDATEVRVIDRSVLILDIFAFRARTREAKTQVELAQLKYLFPRMTGRWSHLERQVGGIGVRGPGEQQLEVDRRQIRKRIGTLEKLLEKIDNQREVQRHRRQQFFRVALVGYTNAGKSTLFNHLTRAEVIVEDRLFSTLDSTSRLVKWPLGPKMILTDTVGFIRKLPTHLVASFRSTLDQVCQADLLLHVVDLASPHFRHQIAEVEKVLVAIEAQKIKRFLVFNKIDALPNGVPLADLAGLNGEQFFISAEARLGLATLVETIRVQALSHTPVYTNSAYPDGDSADGETKNA